MATIRKYHRPSSLDEALGLIARDEVVTEVLGGGTTLLPAPRSLDCEVVDLQGLGFDTVASSDDQLEIGAMVRLRDLVENEATPALLRDLALREGPNTLRNAATIGGTIVSADPESELLAGLLVHEAVLHVATQTEPSDIALDEFLADPSVLAGAILTGVGIATTGRGASAHTARTPADRAIVAAIARRSPDGSVRVAVTGVGATPVLVQTDALDGLDPPADFRGSSDYRRSLAGTLVARAVAGVNAEDDV